MLGRESNDIDVAFAVLARMTSEEVPPDEVVYRTLLDACGRCGKVQRAYEVLQAMAAAGITPDASVYSCLVRRARVCVCGAVCVRVCVRVRARECLCVCVICRCGACVRAQRAHWEGCVSGRRRRGVWWAREMRAHV